MATKDLDGFQSQRDGQIIKFQQVHHQQTVEAIDFINNLKIRDIDPPQQIKTKAYSLQPDYISGWAPKFALPKPINLTYPDAFLKSLVDTFFQNKPQNIELCYLGPRYDNTYSAWKYLNIQFPYKHMSERRIIVSDRNFVGNNPRPHSNCLKFNSMFESGNLDAAFKVNQFQYDCFMRIDANTRGHLQWFYFEISNLKKYQEYRINICNFEKGKSLYTRGMKPYILSKQANELHKQNWKQDGQLISFEKQKSKVEKTLKLDEQQDYYQLSFTISTKYQHDTLILAYCPPYTYSNLIIYLQNMLQRYAQKDIMYEQYIGTTLSGINIPLITITNNVSYQFEQTKSLKPVKHKKLIFVMGRIHPGQSNGSYMVQGLINWLCGNSLESKQVKQRFIFKILPMVNPDGVIIGNYRTGLSGRDLNRQFIDPDKSLFVEINNIKQILVKFKKIYHSSFTHFLDFHGHSIKKNIFTYGPQFSITTTKYYECRILPKLISNKTNLFRYFSCKFSISKSKQSTARAVLIKQFYIPFSYTIQASNGFYVDPQSNTIDMSLQHWIQTGQKIGLALYEYVNILKIIQIKRQQRKKQKQLLNNSRKQRSRKSNSLTKTYQFNIQNNNKSKKDMISIDNKQQRIQAQQIFNDLINEIRQQMPKQSMCSDDELSQGQSDSQNQKNDIDLHRLKDSIFVTQQKIQKSRKSDHHLRVIRIIKRSTINSEFQMKQPQEKRGFNYMRPRKSAVVRKKFELNISTPSPIKTENNTIAKIININFQLHPVEKSLSSPLIPQERIRKTKTEMGMTQISQVRNPRQDRSDSFRRTFLSFHRDIIKKQSNKKIKKLYLTQKTPFRGHQVIGRRIFTQSSN